MEKNKVEVCNGKVWGHAVSEHGLENGRLDYQTLRKIIGDCIFNNDIYHNLKPDWELISGPRKDEEWIPQYYIISDQGASLLKDFTDEIVLYNEDFNVYLWAIDHYGTPWNCVLTGVKLTEEEMI